MKLCRWQRLSFRRSVGSRAPTLFHFAFCEFTLFLNGFRLVFAELLTARDRPITLLLRNLSSIIVLKPHAIGILVTDYRWSGCQNSASRRLSRLQRSSLAMS